MMRFLCLVIAFAISGVTALAEPLPPRKINTFMRDRVRPRRDDAHSLRCCGEQFLFRPL